MAANLAALLVAPINLYQSVLSLLAIPRYVPLLTQQLFSTRRSTAHSVVSSVLKNESFCGWWRAGKRREGDTDRMWWRWQRSRNGLHIWCICLGLSCYACSLSCCKLHVGILMLEANGCGTYSCAHHFEHQVLLAVQNS